MRRLIQEQIVKDLTKKMVFLVGPRQVGKTWLSKQIMQLYKKPVYLNFDNNLDRDIIKKYAWDLETDLVVFDEIHKMKGWKNYIKGVFDTRNEKMHILVTGSARLNAHKNMGDSMAGRFYVHHLFPFTLEELQGTELENDFIKLIEKGGFPEALLGTEDDTNRWRTNYANSLLREDVLNLGNIENLNAMKNIYEILKTRVSTQISYANIAENIELSPKTVKKYIELLEALYIIFIIRPHSKKISSSILKEPKVYFYDWAVVKEDGARFENIVAVSLLAVLQKQEDFKGINKRLAYLKTKQGQEVDFAIINNDLGIDKVLEVKLSDQTVSKSLSYFVEKYKLDSVQIVKNVRQNFVGKNDVPIKNAESVLKEFSNFLNLN